MSDTNPVSLRLPDGSRREFPGPVSGAELAAAIGPGLAKAAIAVKIDGRPRDLATVIDHDADVAIITPSTPEGVEILRHDAAHVMAEAVKELYPQGTEGVDQGEVLRAAFLELRRRLSPGKKG